MCDGFGIICTKDGRYLFCEPNKTGDCSHNIILTRAGIKDNDDTYLRSFVRVQFDNWTADRFEFDETSSLPGWAEENVDEIRNKCVALLERVEPIYSVFQKKILVISETYDQTVNPASKAYIDAYEKYKNDETLSIKKINELIKEAWKVREAAIREPSKIYMGALVVIMREMRAELKPITGYVGA